MKSKFLLKMLGVYRVNSDFDALLASANHIQLTPFGELLDEYEGLQHGVIDPNLAHVFSIVVAFAERPAFAIADLPTYEALRQAVVQLGLLDGRRPIWWVDHKLRLEVRNLKKLDEVLHDFHDFPAMRPYFEATRRDIQRLGRVYGRDKPSKSVAKRRHSGRH
jgi:hypothetical protein